MKHSSSVSCSLIEKFDIINYNILARESELAASKIQFFCIF